VLLPLKGYDKESRGLDTMFVLIACGIVAGNRWDGFLSRTRQGDDRVDLASTPELEEEEYFFHLPNDTGPESNEPYPIVPNFKHWRFPHYGLPTHWNNAASDPKGNLQYVQDETVSRSNITVAVRMRDASCRISGCRESLGVAHLVPRLDLDWWNDNGMTVYNSNPTSGLDDVANCILLREDLHTGFDKPMFVFVPKKNGATLEFVLYLLSHSVEYERLYHNHALHKLCVRVELLFARFAWSIFPLLYTFLNDRERKRLLLQVDSSGTAASKSSSLQSTSAKWLDGLSCAKYSLTSTSNTNSKKRKAENTSPSEDGPEACNLAEKIAKRVRTRASSNKVDIIHNDSLGGRSYTSRNGHETFSDFRSEPSLDAPLPATPTSLDAPLLATPTSYNTLPWIPDDNDAISAELGAAVLRSLQAERARSDPENTWNNKLAWRQEVYDGRALFADDASKWVEVNGGDVEEDIC
jgi:hypothetical protein